MSANEPDPLEFRGKDLKECEQFITAVNKYARAEGKLRDDQWIADFVATCMAGDALLWWGALDEETQRSWKLLRSAMILRYRLQFAGRSGAEAEDFVNWVRQKALDLEKLDDVNWTAKFASGCFVGSALRWYMSLEPGVRDDWVSLQQAIFAQYGQGFEESSSIIPMPAPAASAPVTGAAALVVKNGRHRGRIRVLRGADSENYYLTKVIDLKSRQRGRVYATTSIADALEVECLPASDCPQNLFIPDNQIPGFDVLGMKWYTANSPTDNSPLAICGVDSRLGTGSLARPFNGPILMKAWKISESKIHKRFKSLSVMGDSEVRLACYSDNGRPRLVWFKPQGRPSEHDSELLFEPI